MPSISRPNLLPIAPTERSSRRDFLLRSAQTAALLGAAPLAARAETAHAEPSELPPQAPDASGLFDTSASPLRPYYERFAADHELLGRFYSIPWAPDARAAMRTFFTGWQQQLASVPFEPLAEDGRIDHILLRYHLDHQLALLGEMDTFQQQVAPFLPFAGDVLALEDARRAHTPLDAKAAAAALTKIADTAGTTQRSIESLYRQGAPAPSGPLADKEAANRALEQITTLQAALHTWYVFYDGYDPEFTWWAEIPYQSADAALGAYHATIAAGVLGLSVQRPAKSEARAADSTEEEGGDAYQNSMRNAKPGSSKDIIGHAIGEAALEAELRNAMIPYSPRQLIALANREFAWCEAERLKAAAGMGFGSDWHAALEKMKNDYVAPGQQPQLVQKLLDEAEAFVAAHDLVTVPELARTTWRWRMIPPAQQLVSPFFLGGEVMQISYPTNTMTYAQRITTMRANNIAMSRATVFHELIPGHELQLYMAERYRAYRGALDGTPFLIEGWALYWEMLLWELGFDRTPEQRMGALEWRTHRCARIIFSLSFHLGLMTPQQCIDLLIDRVGFEPEAAAGEVRRSFGGGYSPLYQCAYLLGGLQLRSLRDELVPKTMSYRAFHDAVLRENIIPIEMIRASLTKQPLAADFKTSWRFYGDLPVG